MVFRNREHAGQILATQLQASSYRNPVIFALPRGGIPIGIEVARALHAPLDVLVVRKIGYPKNPEFGVGAIGEGGIFWLDEHTLDRLGLTMRDLEDVIVTEGAEVERRVKKYRGGRSLHDVKGRTAIIVDDGLATGVSARVAARVLRKLGASRIVIAVPVCPPEAAREFRSEVDELICVNRPHLFRSVGQFYEDFPQLRDEEVMAALKTVRNPETEHRLGDLFEEPEIRDKTKPVARPIKREEQPRKT